jgi:cyclic pyranopterin phosphate synthase
MVDVGAKRATRRVAVAEAFLALSAPTLARLRDGEVAKGDALAVARIAGIAGAKRTADLIPLAHPLALTHASVALALEPDGVRVTARTETSGPTGVELEALTAASVAALALYDMVKKLDRGAEIRTVRLLEKRGGESGDFSREPG